MGENTHYSASAQTQPLQNVRMHPHGNQHQIRQLRSRRQTGIASAQTQPPQNVRMHPYRDRHQTSQRRSRHQTGIGHFDLKKNILQMIVEDLHSPRLIEGDGFQHFIKALNPSTDAALSASAIRQDLVKLYNNNKKQVKDAVINAKDLVLSAEVWTSSKEESYITVTCHFVNKKWKMKSYTLDTAQLLGEHTPENVHFELCRISKDWEIKEKILVVLVNVDGMKKSNPKSSWSYIPCFSFTINKVIQEVFDNSDWRCLLKKCRHVDQFFYQEHEAYWCQRLSQSSCVNWLQTLDMVKTICEQWQSFSKVPSYEHREDLWLNENERKLLENMVKVLTVVNNTIKSIGTNGYFSVSNIIPLVENLQLRLQILIQQENKVALRLSEKCKYHFENINQNDWFTVSTALDPRYKNRVLKSDGGENVKTKIIEEMCRESRQGMSSGYQRNISSRLDHEELILQYFTDVNIPENKSPLQYWASKNRFKNLTMVAHKYLSVIATAIPIDQMIHEHQSQIIFNRRKNLEVKDINMMLFLNGNCKNDTF